MDEKARFVVGPDAAGTRLDVFLAARLTRHSRARLAKAIHEGLVTVGGAPAKAGYKLARNEVVECAPVPETPPPDDIVPEDIPLEVVYEDEHLLVVNKPAGMTTHPAAGSRSGTLVHALLGRGGALSRAGGGFRPGIVHRLDKDTSGLMLVAKHDAAHVALSRMIAAREVKRLYECVVSGRPREDGFTVNAPIGRHPRDRKKMAVLPPGTPGARDARTDFEVLERLPRHTVLRARLHTGRTHQVRVHLASIGLPIVGDPVYGAPKSPGGLFALRAYRLELAHPETGEALAFTLDRPANWSDLLEQLRAA